MSRTLKNHYQHLPSYIPFSTPCREASLETTAGFVRTRKALGILIWVPPLIFLDEDFSRADFCALNQAFCRRQVSKTLPPILFIHLYRICAQKLRLNFTASAGASEDRCLELAICPRFGEVLSEPTCLLTMRMQNVYILSCHLLAKTH